MRRISLALLIALVVPTLAAGASKDTKLTLVAYSTPKDAYAQLTAAFQKTKAGNGVTFSQSFAASGEQSRAVAAGLDADIVAFSLEPDITSLVQKNLVAKTWNKDKYKGMVTRSVVVFVVRDGNPKKLKTWNDLLKPGVQVITPNPFTSGGARWNVMAAYGGALRSGKTPKQAVDYLGKLWKHVVAQPTSAREGLQTFLAGRGDVFLAYENEALFAQQKKQPVQFVIPKATILIENPIAVPSTSKHKTEANAFVKYLRTPAAQKIFAQNGYRPVVASAARGFNFPTRPQLFTIKYVGGWATVEKRFFDPNTGIMTRFQGSSGG
ncbi:MAG: sulfate/thiosulfate transport system substrate-binding protein [Gaiellaceae bacterium]|nr:sulfate/thiosulfate transport system substrate-binding protein [Gaiellaceae bacterium]